MALPVSAILGDLADALGERGVAVLSAPPGTGKSTLVPLALAAAPWLGDGRVLVLEPRRLAARAVARRLAQLSGEPVGRRVGHRMRGDTMVSEATVVEVVTEGVLTRMAVADPGLEGVGAVIFDEFHERSLDADLGLALCLEARTALRPDLRLLVMSATLDIDGVAGVLATAATDGGVVPVVEVMGRTHPVDVRWVPPPPRPAGRRAGEREADHEAAVADVVRRALAEVPVGDVLVFLPGAREIRRVAQRLGGAPAAVLPLHGSLPPADQDRALAPDPHGRRKVVLATTIAQTSLTIEGVTVVVDSGYTRVARFDPRRGLGGLHTQRVSRAAATQRAGRAGRLGPGVCYRLWSEVEHHHLAAADLPEMATADLASLALDLARWGDPGGDQLVWLDPPPPPALAAARDLLARLSLVDDRGRPTAEGLAVARLGLHPRLGHAVVAATARGHGGLACDLAALLEQRDGGAAGSGADVRERLAGLRAPGRARDEARRLRRRSGVGGTPGTGDTNAAGAVLARAWPDRVARRRDGGSGRYLLASGAGAVLAPGDPLAGHELLVAVDVDRPPGGGDARIRLAAPVDEADLVGTEDVAVVRWDPRQGEVRARRERHYGALVLASGPLAAPPAGSEVAALLEGVAQLGLAVLAWTPATSGWRDRVAFLHRAVGPPWPDVGDDALVAALADWLGPALVSAGARRRADLVRVDLGPALGTLLAWPLPRRLGELAPTHLPVPSGRSVRVDYGGEQPVLAVRLQECFGWTETPRVADGTVPVVIHLLSPAGRPLAVTADLASFWAGPYRQVRGEMRGRYPKHNWPEDPLAEPPAPPRRRRS